MKCPKCSSRDIDFQEAGGQSICVNCGTVLEENTIISSIEFQETGDRSHVIGQYVSANCSKPFMSSSRLMGRHLDIRDSRDTTLFNARKTIAQLASTLKLPQLYIDRAYRLYQLALQRNFIFGRRQTHVSAACLYIICRQEKSPHLLIDFSDALQINVYLLGKAFLHFLKVLNLEMPVIDPSLYIHRYASKLEFGNKMNSVVLSALRIISRLKKDWIVTGRRPDGVCAAALLISSRAYGFNVTQENTAQLFKIAQDTLRRRLLEFRSTPSAQLNMEELFLHDLEVEFDPPSFINRMVAENDVELELSHHGSTINAEDLAKDDVFSNLVDEELSENINLEGKLAVLKFNERRLKAPLSRKASHNKGVFSEKQEETTELYTSISWQLSEPSLPSVILASPSGKRNGFAVTRGTKIIDRKVVVNVPHEENLIFSSKEYAEVPALSESESSNYLFGDEEKMKRAAIWEKTFGSFMEERARRKREREHSDENADKYTQSGKLRRKYAKQLTSRTTSEAVLSSQTKLKGASKKINYEALKGVFAGDGAFAIPEPLEEFQYHSTKVSKSSDPPTKIVFNSSTDPVIPNNRILQVKQSKLEEVEDEEEEEIFLYEEEEDYTYEDEYY